MTESPGPGDPAASAAATIEYVYGVVRTGLDTSSAPAGIGGAVVALVSVGELAALTSSLDAAEFAPALVEEKLGDLEWLAPLAEAHDSVLSWAGTPGPVVPFHMWALFTDSNTVRGMIGQRAAELSSVLAQLDGADEFGLRVYVDAVALESAAASGSAEIAELESATAAAGPGQRYLLERKLERARRDAAREMAAASADRVYAALAQQSVDSVRDEIPSSGAEEASAVLSAAFLVRRDSMAAFRAALTELVRRLEPQGFRFAFTGPWPAYHFADGAG